MKSFGIAIWENYIHIALNNCNQIMTKKKSLLRASDLSKNLNETFHDFYSNDISQILVMTGPGSFTGLRVLLSYIHGISLCLPNIRILSLNYFEIIEQIISIRPLLILGPPHNNQKISCYIENKSKKFLLDPQTINIHPKNIIDLNQQEWNIGKLLLQCTYHHQKNFPLPFYGYHPEYKKIS